MDRVPDGHRAMNSELLQQVSPDLPDPTTWFHALLPEPISQSPLGPGPSSQPTHFYLGSASGNHVVGIADTWTDQIVAGSLVPALRLQQSQQVLTAVEAEDSGIRLVYALLTCAEAIQRGDFRLAVLLVNKMSNDLRPRVNPSCGIGKVAGYFIDALTRRLYPQRPVSGLIGSILAYQVLYEHFYEACPFLKFAHFTANQAILEAFDGHDCVHIIDFGLIHGLQWPALIQALAVRPGGPPFVRLTGIGPPSEYGSCSLQAIGSTLAQFAQSMNVGFAFRAVAVSRLEDIKPWMVETSPNEVVTVNSIFQLHRLIGSGIDPVLNWVRSLNPKIVTLAEQEANHNQPEFLARFTEALHYYSTMFDSLEACQVQSDKDLAELYLERELSNIVCCEGSARVERHEPLAQWRARMARAGFKKVDMGQNAFKQVSMLLSLSSAEGYCVEESEGCLKLGWHDRPLIAASAWRAGTQAESSSTVVLDGSSSCSSSA